MLVVLDTTVLIDCLRGRPVADRVDELWDRGDTPATSSVCVEEVRRGLRPGETEAARSLISSLVVLAVDEAVAWQSGSWRQDFAARGVTLHQADCLVAATAHGSGARLCTGNPQDFPMPDLMVEHWPVGG